MPTALNPEEIVQLGAALKAAREILCFKLAELAEAALVNEARLIKFEKGTLIPTKHELGRIWGILSAERHSLRVGHNGGGP